MAGLYEVVEAITEMLKGIGLNAYPKPMKSLDSPAAIVTIGPAAAQSTQSGDGRDRQVSIDLFVTDGPEGIQNLYEYLDAEGDKSLIQLFDDDQTLDGLVSFTDDLTWEQPNLATVGASEFLHVGVALNVGLT